MALLVEQRILFQSMKTQQRQVATKTGCRIVPMAISNSESVFEKQIPFLRPAHVVLQYGKPIDIVELAPEEKKFIGAYTQKIIENMLIDNQNYL